MLEYKLDKIFKVGTVYRAESDKGYVIEFAGTASTTPSRIKVAGAPCLEFTSDIAPLAKINTNLFGPISLGDQKIVVPPDKTLEFEDTSGDKVRLVGKILELAVGETFPADLVARYHEQVKKFISYKKGTYSHGTDAAWSADVENDVLTFSIPQGEHWTFNHILAATVANVSGGLAAGQFGIRLYKDDKPFDLIETSMGVKGIDVVSCHLPPKEDVNFVPFTLADFPITFEPGRTLRISCINVSGASISPTAGASLDVTVYIVGIREYI